MRNAGAILVGLFCLGLVYSQAYSQQNFDIRRAAWSPGGSRLVVWGVGEEGETVVVSNADTYVVLGYADVVKGRWRLRTSDLPSVPCRIRAVQSDGKVAAQAVKKAPQDCDDAGAQIRTAYVIPSNRSPQGDAVQHLQSRILLLNGWLCEQMDRNGFSRLGLRYETEEDGITPLIQVVDVAETDDFLRGNTSLDLWFRTIEAASNAGVSVWIPGEIWLMVPEVHVQLENGSIQGGVAFGAGFGSGNDPGVAMLGSDRLWQSIPEDLMDNTPYDGLIIPEVGPFPLVFGTSYASFELETISTIASSATGATLHEIGHALGLAHDWRNDTNFHGNLMFNGLRGIRGSLFPDLYPDDDMRLSYAAALVLRTSRYITPEACRGRLAEQLAVASKADESLERAGGRDGGRLSLVRNARGERRVLGEDRLPEPPPTQGLQSQTAIESQSQQTDNERPTVELLTSGSIEPIDGQVEIEFIAGDEMGLSAALLRLNGDTIAEMPLSGTDTTGVFTTPFLQAGRENFISVTVYDVNGNLSESFANVTPLTGFNMAPQPFFQVFPSQVSMGDEVVLDASGSSDPDQATADLLIEWDLNGDGVADTPASLDKELAVRFREPGNRLIRVLVTDLLGARSVSTPIAVRVGGKGGLRVAQRP
jgi:hypothetical protein